jgi:hypothetical protein
MSLVFRKLNNLMELGPEPVCLVFERYRAQAMRIVHVPERESEPLSAKVHAKMRLGNRQASARAMTEQIDSCINDSLMNIHNHVVSVHHHDYIRQEG